METKQKYEVVIIGAGPAGLSAAINLNKLGLKDILVIEKYKFPRYKCCAGYITKKTSNKYKEMGLDINACNYSFIENFNIFYKLKKRQTIINKFLYTNKHVDRVELDNAFYKLAKKKGIKILEETIIKDNDVSERCILISNNHKIYYDYLIFADGTNSFGNKYQKNNKKNIAMQLTFKSKTEEKIDIHFGITKRGYAWASTSSTTTNIGITDVFNPKENYRKVFKKFLKDLNLKAEAKNLKGSFTPIGMRKPIINKYIYFVGDAVGACDPLTLSGLRYGLASGEYCAKAIKNRNSKIYKKFISKLKIKFFIMKILLKLFYLQVTLFCVFEIGCRFFSKMIEKVFNNFFVNKK